jgi:lipopolysaccharide/colanic/teichoic acid biosynthesis glycosyltransferase
LIKRIFDISVASMGILVFFPIVLCAAILIWWKMGSPIFFRQKRPGLHGKPFLLLKLRTMNNLSDAAGGMLADDERLTPLGKFLRATSIDELPELWNVLRGDMSLVGPRPLLMEYMPLYTMEQARRHEVRPGITGWAQISGRNNLAWDDKFRLDVWYVDNRSLWLDLKIILRTAQKVLKQEGISGLETATMTRFKGPRS